MTSPHHILAIFDVGGGEMIMIFLVILLLFGGQRMPELAKGLGKSIREFKKATSGVEDQIRQAIEDAPEKPAPAPRKAIAPVSPVSTPPPAATDLPATQPPSAPPPSTPPEITP